MSRAANDPIRNVRSDDLSGPPMSLPCQQGDHANCWEDDCFCPLCGCQERNEWDYTGGYSRSDLLFGGNW